MKKELALEPLRPPGGGQQQEDRRISEVVARERSRLLNFIRRSVPDRLDAEDILQDVFYELVEASRLLEPIEQVGAWLFRVARNRIVDRFRRRQVREDAGEAARAANVPGWEDLLPSTEAGPEQAFARSVLLEEFEEALAELPAEQREVFVAHELDGRSFRELAEATGVSVNTLLSRKRYAVLHLRRRLQAIYEEFVDQREREI